MTTQEMHIEIDLELQKINSFSNKNILPQEKDWFLNNEVMKFLKQRTDKTSDMKQSGFENDIKRIEDIKDLLRNSNRDIQDDNQGGKYITFPPDYFDYIRTDTTFIKDCDGVDVNSNKKRTYKVVIPIVAIPEELTELEITIITTGGNHVMFSYSDFPVGYLSGDTFSKQQFLVYKALEIVLNKKLKVWVKGTNNSYELYREIEGNNYEQDSFTLLTDKILYGVRVTINGNIVNYSSTNFDSEVFETSSYNLKSKLRIINEEFLTDVSNSHLSKSRVNSPIGNMLQSTIKIEEPKGAILTKATMVYICMPNQIDLLLNSNLNMKTKIAKEIVSNTVRFIKGLVETNNYESYVRENVLVE